MTASDRLDRIAGVLLGQACGDALGVPYEFGPSLPAEFEPQMIGGGLGPFAPGEYSDDTSMAVCIAQVAATGADLTSFEAIDAIAVAFLEWGEDAPDVGTQTRSVFEAASHLPGTRGEALTQASREHAFAHAGHVGNGALMRTAIVGLTRLDDRDATASAARAVSAITHADPLALESCVLWSEAVRVAAAEARLDLLGGLDLIPEPRQTQWRTWIDEATNVDPRTFNPNGFTVHALQAAWAAITWTSISDGEPSRHLQDALKNAVRVGNDTDTVAAIAGGLLGARWGRSAVPDEWASLVHGYGGYRADGLVDLAERTASGGQHESAS